jgi:dihydroflavonol-4-reductase
MNVLVTGATGFVGGWLTKALLAENSANVTSVKILARNLPDKLPFDIKKVKHAAGDVTNLTSLTAAMKDVDLVFHLAGVVGYSLADRQKMQEVNVDGTANILAAAKTTGCRRIIYMSSVAAVGASFNGKSVLNENSEYNLGPLNLGYFETKRAAEKLVLNAAKSGEIQAVVLNPSNIYGPSDAQKGSRGTQVKIARGKFPFYTSGGVSIVHVKDVVEALVAAVTRGRNGERYILSGENLRIHELFEMIAASAGVDAPKIYLPNMAVSLLANLSGHLEKMGRRGPVSSESARASILFHWFDSSKAQRELGFRFTHARVAINDSVTWMKENGVI